MSGKTFNEAAADVRAAGRKLVDAVGHALRLDKLLDWLSPRLERRRPWANAHRIRDEHDREVTSLETDGWADAARAQITWHARLAAMREAFPMEMTESGVYARVSRLVDPNEALAAELTARICNPPGRGEPIKKPTYLVFEGALSPGQMDTIREMLVDGYSHAEIEAAIQPPAPPPHWRWWRDPLVYGFTAAFVIIGRGLVWLGGN